MLNLQKKAQRKSYKKSVNGRAYNRRYRKKKWLETPTYLKHLYHRYGLEQKDYEMFIEKQKSSCAICGFKPENVRKLHIDHCHKTKKVRGLLCGSCNRALGLMKENTEFLNKAIKYLCS